MKIKIITKIDPDGYVSEDMYINDKPRLFVCSLCECPEDAVIGRDLVSCSNVVDYMELAYEAAKNGEDLEIEYIEEG